LACELVQLAVDDDEAAQPAVEEEQVHQYHTSSRRSLRRPGKAVVAEPGTVLAGDLEQGGRLELGQRPWEGAGWAAS
jgi:hypothetical protein